jgi:PAS domain S-box-containing protein
MSQRARTVSERRRPSAAHVRSILDNTLDPVMALDAGGRVCFWNPQAEETFGWSRDDALGRELAEIALSDIARDELRRSLEGPPLAGSRRLEVEGRHRDGREFPLELTLTPIPDDPEFRFSAFARDLTERKEAERERERLHGETERAREQAERASRVKDEFLATLSHELRTPLTAIVGWTYLLRNGRLDDATLERALAVIERNAGAQAQVIADILDLSRIVAARFRLRMRRLDLGPVVAAALDNVMPAARAKELHVKPVLDADAGPVLGDADRLRQVAWNLLSNAVKFTPRGGHVSVRLRRSGSSVELEVEDDGAGIPEVFLPHVFDRFRQADSSNTRGHGGLGIGLAVVRHLVELHGGTVSAESAGPGRGARFRVAFPLMAESLSREAGPTLAPEPPPHDQGQDLGGVRVLVVDGDADVRDVFSEILRHSGAEVAAVAGAEGGARPPHVILCDLEMEIDGGRNLVHRLRALPPDHGGAVPVAALSAQARIEDRVDALRAGFQMHLAKPIHPAELVAVVASLAGRSTPANCT